MAEQVGLDAVVRPDVDSRATSRAADRMGNTLSKAAEITPSLNLRGVRSAMESAIPGMGLLSGLTGGGGGRGGGGGSGGGIGEVVSPLESIDNTLDQIRRELRKQGVSGALSEGEGGGLLGSLRSVLGGGAAGVGGGLASRLGLSGIRSGLASGAGRVAGGVRGAAGAIGGTGGRAAGGAAGLGSGLVSGFIANRSRQAVDRDEDDRGFIDRKLAEIFGEQMGGTTVAATGGVGGEALAEAAASAITGRLREEMDGLPSLEEALQFNAADDLRGVLSMDNVPSLTDALGVGDLPSLESAFGGVDDFVSGVESDLSGLTEIDLTGDIENLGERIVENLGDPQNIYEIDLPLEVSLDGLDELQRELRAEIDNAVDDVESRIRSRIDEGFFGR